MGEAFLQFTQGASAKTEPNQDDKTGWGRAAGERFQLSSAGPSQPEHGRSLLRKSGRCQRSRQQPAQGDSDCHPSSPSTLATLY